MVSVTFKANESVFQIHVRVIPRSCSRIKIVQIRFVLIILIVLGERLRKKLLDLHEDVNSHEQFELL